MAWQLHDDPDQKIIILTLDESDQLVDELLKAGVRGYVLKSDAACNLVLAVEALLQKKTFFTPPIAERIAAGFLGHYARKSATRALPTLTPRELEVVQLLAEGKSTKEVAITLDLSVKTAETHRNNIMRKLGVHNLCHVVLYAVRNHIVQFSRFDSPIDSPQQPL
jgi:DNA-binding NarL/FixJ family response regulator